MKDLFKDHLLPGDWHGDKILKGSQDMPYNENYPHWPHKGIGTYGTQKINGKTCLRIALRDEIRARGLGWKLVHCGTHYAFILPPGWE